MPIIYKRQPRKKAYEINEYPKISRDVFIPAQNINNLQKSHVWQPEAREQSSPRRYHLTRLRDETISSDEDTESVYLVNQEEIFTENEQRGSNIIDRKAMRYRMTYDESKTASPHITCRNVFFVK